MAVLLGISLNVVTNFEKSIFRLGNNNQLMDQSGEFGPIWLTWDNEI